MINVVLLVVSLCLFALSKLAIWRVFFKRKLRDKQYAMMQSIAWIIILLTFTLTIIDHGSYGVLTLIGYSAPALVVLVCVINSVKRIRNRP